MVSDTEGSLVGYRRSIGWVARPDGTEDNTMTRSESLTSGTATLGRTCRAWDGTALELTLIARKSRVLDCGNVTPTYIELCRDSTLAEMLQVLADHHGFSTTSVTTLHVDPLPSEDVVVWHPRGGRPLNYRLAQQGVGDGDHTVRTALPQGATGYLCVGSGQWLWFVRSVR